MSQHLPTAAAAAAAGAEGDEEEIVASLGGRSGDQNLPLAPVPQRRRSRLLPAAATAVAEDDEEEIRPSLGGRHGDQDLSMAHGFPRRRRRLLPAMAAEEDEEDASSLGWDSEQRDRSIHVTQVPRHHSEGSQRPFPCRGLFTAPMQRQEQVN